MVAIRDKKVAKYLFVCSCIYTVVVFTVLGVRLSEGYDILKWIVFVSAVSFDILSLYYLLLPSTAIKSTKEGIYVFYLRKTMFYSYEEVLYASHKEQNSRYARSDNAWIFYHREQNDIGTVYIAVDKGDGLQIISLRSITQSNFVAYWITDEVKKKEEERQRKCL